MAGDERVTATSDLLRRLVDRAEYSHRWRPRVSRRTGVTSQSAIAHVLAEYLWAEGIRSETETDLPRRLKDTVSRAFSATSLSARTLTWFIGAFEMSDEHASRLWSSRFGDVSRVREVHGTATPEIAGWRATHRTLALAEVHTLGPVGIPVLHHTNQVIIATKPMDRYSYRFDAREARVELLRGGAATEAREIDSGLYCVDFVLTHPLDVGDVAFLEYVTTLLYTERPPPEFRRAGYTRMEAVRIAVQFDAACSPEAVWWAEWSHHLDPDPRTEELVEVGPDGVVQTFLGAVENVTVGYRWRFSTQDLSPAVP